jgi:preprotein translocase subunit YajC
MKTYAELVVAQAAPAPEPSAQAPGGGANFILLMIAMGLLMYALLIRPQQRQQKEHKNMIAQIKKGDQIITSGGMHGRVTGVTEDVITVEIAERVRVKLNKSAVSSRVTPGEGEKS